MSEWLKRLTFGSAAWNAWRREHPDLVITLDHADLNGMILTGIDFARVSLRGADLTGADLTEADLICANLAGAILSGARFVEADFLGASLGGAHYSPEDLEGALHVPTRVEER